MEECFCLSWVSKELGAHNSSVVLVFLMIGLAVGAVPSQCQRMSTFILNSMRTAQSYASVKDPFLRFMFLVN